MQFLNFLLSVSCLKPVEPFFSRVRLILPVFRLCFPADTATQSAGLCFFTAMERKVRTEERTRREGEKVKSVMEDDFTED